jgi:DNA-binding YbaB/EbfC family protein
VKVKLPGSGGNFAQLAKKAQEIQSKLSSAIEELETKEYSASSGGGAVIASVSGAMLVNEIKIKSEVISPDDPEMLADMIIAAVNEALRKASEEKESIQKEISGQMIPPGLI